MSNPGDADTTPITSVRQLADYLAVGCKPASEARIGTEHEKFGFYKTDFTPPPYAPRGIEAMLHSIAATGWDRIEDKGHTIGLKRGGESVSLEPAGQFELSGAPLRDLHQTVTEFERHFADVRAAAEQLGLGFAPLGFQPLHSRDAMPWMPKSRYAIMRRYMPLVGSLGLDMMTRTCTVQVNLDFESEADMAAKLKVSLALQPVATALFANSPFYEGKPNGLLSNRAHIWTDTDNARSGMPSVLFAEDFGFERYVEWVLDVPMYFAMRDGEMIDLAGASFRDFMAGKLTDPRLGVATMGDFADHITTAFTDVRLKRFLEMRGADAGTPEMMVAQSALWVGLLYDKPSLAAALELVRKHPWEDYAALRPAVARDALGAAWGTGTLRDLARDMVELATQGLRARDIRNAAGEDESVLLAPLHSIIHGAPTQAEHWLQRFNGEWQGDVTRIFAEAAI